MQMKNECEPVRRGSPHATSTDDPRDKSEAVRLISAQKSFTVQELQNDKRAPRAGSSTLWPSVLTLVCCRSSSHSEPKVHSAPSARGLL
jgi:hypothetical protein